ncbi:MAG: hypothetical protein LBP55_01045 [Candidatus Adiutrix sp.]|jgi:hypothetical protein|nr:hypothetical protein [Candidatus Adiutrix sp.]
MTWTARPPFILDLDGSVGQLAEDEIRRPLQAWQETLRFGCGLSALERFEERLNLPPDHGCLFLGSGDYHHLSLLPLRQLSRAGQKFDLVVCDNHPDNMRYPFGVHCGSWIRRAAQLAGVHHIHVLGITSGDIGWPHAWENNLAPLLAGRLTYWSIGQGAPWLKLLGHPGRSRCLATADDLLAAFTAEQTGAGKIYLSIDKDVFGEEVVKTNWDQGLFEKKHLRRLIGACAGRLVGADVTGEISAYAYQGLFKRLLTRWEDQAPPEPSLMAARQRRQQDLNLEIMALLHSAGR